MKDVTYKGNTYTFETAAELDARIEKVAEKLYAICAEERLSMKEFGRVIDRLQQLVDYLAIIPQR